MDATADEKLLARLFEASVAVELAEFAPPPNTRDIAVRTGKRYGKRSLTARHGREPFAGNRGVPLPAPRARVQMAPKSPLGAWA